MSNLLERLFGADGRNEAFESFVAENKYDVREQERDVLCCCVDGRVDEDFDKEMAPLAIPGASAGYFLIGLAATRILAQKYTRLMSQEKIRPFIIGSALDIVGGRNKFRFHTDERAEESARESGLQSDDLSIARGCGHLKKAESDPSAYGLDASDMNYVFNELSNLLKFGAIQRTLRGGHQEKAVITVKNLKTGLRHRHFPGGGDAFVYHEGLHAARLARFAKALSDLAVFKNEGINERMLIRVLTSVSDNQLKTTLGLLGADKLPQHTVA